MPASSERTKNVPRRGSVGSDGLSDRERKFAQIKRENPEFPNWQVAETAGFVGSRQRLTERARILMKKEAVMLLITAPRKDAKSSLDVQDVSDEDLKKEIRRRWRKIVVSERATDSDAIKAGDKLMATIPGGYVPVQINSKSVLTLERVVAMMGGAPADLPKDHPALAVEPKDEEDDT